LRRHGDDVGINLVDIIAFLPQ